MITYGLIALGGFVVVCSAWRRWDRANGLVLIFMILIAFAYAEVFHNAMLPGITPAAKVMVSGLAFALGI